MSAGAELMQSVNAARSAPPAQGGETASDRHVFVVCSGESCQHAGARRLLGLLKHHCAHHGESHDIRISSSKCLGRCGIAPAMVENGKVLGWVSLHRLKSELTRLGLLSVAS